MKLKSLIAATAIAAVFSASQAGAAVSVGSSLGFTPATLINFEQAPANANINSYYAGQGVTFNTLYNTYGYNFPPNLSGGGATNYTPIFNVTAAQDFVINFTSDQQAAGFAFVADSAATFSTYLDGSLVDTINAGTGTGSNNIVSFTNSNFDQIVFTGSGDHAVLIDNLGFGGAVPEPATWAMMLMGFGVMGAAMRSARRKHILTAA